MYVRADVRVLMFACLGGRINSLHTCAYMHVPIVGVELEVFAQL